jgi:DNA mismatch repair protein MutL
VIILDQHGAHKRILYEKLLQNIRGTPTTLPVPTVVRLPDDLAPEV